MYENTCRLVNVDSYHDGVKTLYTDKFVFLFYEFFSFLASPASSVHRMHKTVLFLAVYMVYIERKLNYSVLCSFCQVQWEMR